MPYRKTALSEATLGWIADRLMDFVGKSQVTREVMEKFKVSPRTAWRWVDKANKKLAEENEQELNEKRQFVFLEMMKQYRTLDELTCKPEDLLNEENWPIDEETGDRIKPDLKVFAAAVADSLTAAKEASKVMERIAKVLGIPMTAGSQVNIQNNLNVGEAKVAAVIGMPAHMRPKKLEELLKVRERMLGRKQKALAGKKKRATKRPATPRARAKAKAPSKGKKTKRTG